MPDVVEILSTNLKAARAKRGISQEELADLTGLDRTYVSGVERGVRNPTIRVLQRLADGLGTSPDALLKNPSR